jgi:putative hemolysin
MPWKPPGGTTTFAFPLLLGVALVPLATLAGDLALVVYLVAAETLAVFGNIAEVALERHSRGRVLDMARARNVMDAVEARLAHVPSYAFTARLTRFLGHALIVAGVGYLAFRDHFVPGHTEGSGAMPWDRIALVIGVVFAVAFLVNDVAVRLLTARRPNRMLLKCLPGLELLRIVLTPLRVPLVWLVRLLFRVNLDAAAPSAREGILETVEEGEREGSFTREEADMIGSIIGMDDSLAKDVLTPRADVVMVQADATMDDVLNVIREAGFSRLPVYGQDRDDVIGVLYTHDLLEHLMDANGDGAPAEPASIDLHEMMRKPFFVPENKPINDLLREMRARKVHLAVVLDEFNGTAGVITIEDLLEEIVGEIEDEYDEDSIAPEAVEVGDGALRVDGRTPIEEVNRALGIALPIEEDFETMSGLVFHHLGKVPDPGERVDLDGVSVTILEADERTVQSMQVEVGPAPHPAPPELP